MKKQIVINASKDRSRIAIVEDGELVELYVENPENVRTLGNIYLGRVQKVMPTLRAAFVDVGLKQDAFLHFSDLTDNAPQLLAIAGEDIPGLDTPLLALAPSKRIADDESEPSVEDRLEIESEPAKSRTSRRRRGGRGRTRRNGDDAHVEEEEEQEEASRGRRRPLVIDLTTRPARQAPNGRPAASTPPSDTPAAPTAEASEEASGEGSSSRRRGRGRGAQDATTDTPASDSSAPEPTTEASVAQDLVTDAAPAHAAVPAPSRGRRAPRGSAATADSAGAQTDAAEARPTPRRAMDPAVARVEAILESALSDLTAPIARRPVPIVREDADETAYEERDADETPTRAYTDAPAADTDETGDAPRSRGGRRRGRGRGGEAKAPAETSDDRPAPAATPDEDTRTDEAPRGRRAAGARRDDTRADDTRRDDARRDDARDNEAERTAEPQARDSRRTETEAPEGRRSDGRRSETARSDSSRSDNGREARGARSGDAPRGAARGTVRLPPTEELLRRDGRVLVKITKEPISAKGCRVSTDLSLAGRFLVLVPAADYVAVSKKIESARERRRLRTLAQELKPEGFGVIVRTVAEDRDAKSLETDLRLLVDKWRKIERKLAEKPPPPVLLYEDVNMVSSIIRDLFSDDFDRILVDDPRVFKNVQAYVKAVAPQMADKVELHRGSAPVYRAVGIERQVEEAFSKRVNLKGGGYLFIETTEAMHVVDVNSGRAGRGKSQKDNLIAVNVEAAREVAKQLRLRDLGGIIVVDFIDLKYDRDRKKVTDALKEGFAKDRAVTKLLPMSDFGLVQITRQRLRPSITSTATDEDGVPRDASEAARLAGASEIEQPGRRWDDVPDAADDFAPAGPTSAPAAPSGVDDPSPEGLTANLRAWLGRYRESVDERYRGRPVVVRVHPLLGTHLRRGFVSTVTRWKLSLRGVPFRVEDDPTLHPLAFDVRDEKSGRSLRKKYD